MDGAEHEDAPFRSALLGAPQRAQRAPCTGRAAQARPEPAGRGDLGVLQAFVKARGQGPRKPPGSPTDRGTREIRPRHNGSEQAGAILGIEQVSPSVRIVRVARPGGFQFRAGQHIKLGAAGARERRPYTIASAPSDAELQFCVEHVPGGALTPTLFSLGVGDRLELGNAAKGSFALDPQARTHVMVATVTGIAPLRSMLRAAPADAGRFVVLHGASYADELPYLQELRQLAARDPRVRYVPTVSRPAEARNRAWQGETGRVDDLALRIAAELNPVDARVYACGNPGMVQRVARELGARGFRVSTEAFD
ncbi:MAG: FAD-binding oxidoreductase [Myxococcales bacterium]|jgi:ferredoxin--NADP+ reductase